MAIVRGWHRQGRTVVAVLHDLDLIRAAFPQRCCWAASRSPGARQTQVADRAPAARLRDRPAGAEAWRTKPAAVEDAA